MNNLILSNPIISSLIISFAINTLFFFFAYSLKTDKVTDLSYSLTFFILTSLFFIINSKNILSSQLIVGLSIILWSIRLGSYLLIRIVKMGRDKRFDSRRDDFIEFMKFWIIQAAGVWFIMLPFSLYLSKTGVVVSFPLFSIGLCIGLLGLIIETISDIQKFNFKSKEVNANKWIETGLWKYSRHPNYLGELMFWWGLFISIFNNLNGLEYLTILGPVTITLLIVFVTGIPLLEKNYNERYKDNEEYKRYKSSTNKLFFTFKK